MGHDVAPHAVVVRDAIGADQVVDRVVGDGLAKRRVRPVIPRELRLESDDAAVLPDAQARGVLLIAVGGRRQEVLAPRLDPLDRPAETARHRGHQDVLGIHVALDAEAPTHLGRNDAHVLLGHAEHARDGAAHREGHLCREPDGQEPSGRVLGSQDGARLDGHARHARVVEAHLDHGVGGGQALGGAADPRL